MEAMPKLFVEPIIHSRRIVAKIFFFSVGQLLLNAEESKYDGHLKSVNMKSGLVIGIQFWGHW